MLNLQRQGYDCYLPMIPAEKLRRGAVTVVLEPLFARYLFIQLGLGQSAQSWAPIRSTQGVSRLVTFGAEPAMLNPELIETLRTQSKTLGDEPARRFSRGDRVQIKEGPFAGLQAVYQIADGERRAMVLIEILGKLSKLTFEPANLQEV